MSSSRPLLRSESQPDSEEKKEAASAIAIYLDLEKNENMQALFNLLRTRYSPPEKIEEIEIHLSSSRNNKVFSYIIIFNDSTGMASSIYFIIITITASTLLAWIGVFSMMLTTLFFSWYLYKKNSLEEVRNKEEIANYKKLIDNKIEKEKELIEEIQGSVQTLTKYFKEDFISIPLNGLDNQEQTDIKEDEKIVKEGDKIYLKLKDYIRLLANSKGEDTAVSSHYHWDINSRFIMTVVTSSGTIFTIGKLILTAIGMSLAGSAGLALLGSGVAIALPTAYFQRKFSNRIEKYMDKLKTEKEKTKKTSTASIDKLLGLKLYLSEQIKQALFTPRPQQVDSSQQTDSPIIQSWNPLVFKQKSPASKLTLAESEESRKRKIK